MSLQGRKLILVGTGLLATCMTASLLAAPTPQSSAPWTILGLVGCGLVWAASATPSSLKPSSKSIAGVLVTLSFLLYAAGVATIDWPEYKFPWFAPVYSLLPSLPEVVRWKWLGNGLQPNQVGGVWAVIASFWVCFGLVLRSSMRRTHHASAGFAAFRWASWILGGVGAVLTLMSGSRSALVALVISLGCVLVLLDKRWLVGIAVALTGLGVWSAANQRQIQAFMQLVLRDDTLLGKTATRLDIWRSALAAFEDHPITGIGLGSFNVVVPSRYPYASVGLSHSVSQAHNIFLDTALTLGVFGLVGLILVLVGAVLLATKTSLKKEPNAPIHTGMLSVAIVYTIFGLTDGFSFSSPASLVLWVCLSVLLLTENLEHTPLTYAKSDDRF